MISYYYNDEGIFAGANLSLAELRMAILSGTNLSEVNCHRLIYQPYLFRTVRFLNNLPITSHVSRVLSDIHIPRVTIMLSSGEPS
jgi:uncharacterized protein YjbI with pentapeptide repeats